MHKYDAPLNTHYDRHFDSKLKQQLTVSSKPLKRKVSTYGDMRGGFSSAESPLKEKKGNLTSSRGETER